MHYTSSWKQHDYLVMALPEVEKKKLDERVEGWWWSSRSAVERLQTGASCYGLWKGTF